LRPSPREIGGSLSSKRSTGNSRRARELLEKSSVGAARFPRKVKQFLGDALDLRDRRDAGKISGHGLAVARGRLEKRLDRLLARKPSHEANPVYIGTAANGNPWKFLHKTRFGDPATPMPSLDLLGWTPQEAADIGAASATLAQ
jgi:hypothetical protein